MTSEDPQAIACLECPTLCRIKLKTVFDRCDHSTDVQIINVSVTIHGVSGGSS